MSPRKKFIANGFSYRHTANSSYSHLNPLDGGDPVEALAGIAEALWKPEYDKVERSVYIPLDQAAMDRFGDFYTALDIVTSRTCLKASFEQRETHASGELPYLQAKITGGVKKRAAGAALIVYAEKALTAEEKIHDGQCLDAEFHVITLLANLDCEPSPMAPVTMMRNHSARVVPDSPEAIGGTAFDAKPCDYLGSILYWRDKLLCARQGECQGSFVLPEQLVSGRYQGLVPVNSEQLDIEAFFGPAVPGGVSFVQFRSPNAVSRRVGRLWPRSPYELACSHARWLEMPEGEGLVGVAYEPSAEEYRQSILLYSNHLRCRISL